LPILPSLREIPERLLDRATIGFTTSLAVSGDKAAHAVEACHSPPATEFSWKGRTMRNLIKLVVAAAVSAAVLGGVAVGVGQAGEAAAPTYLAANTMWG
jgi:hypothetical protein